MQVPSIHFALPPILFFTLTIASPLYPRDIPSHGPEGDLTPMQRWHDTIGTALQIYGPTPRHGLISTLRSGPLSSVFRSSLLSNEGGSCEPRSDTKCELAINGFGSVGEVHYNFSNNIRKVEGHSTQVMIACRCLSKECGVAILLRPVNVLSRETNETIRRTCLYEVFRGKYSDCHTELMRVSYRPVDQPPEFYHGNDSFEYYPRTERKVWFAEGQRGWTHDCFEDEVACLRRIDLKSIKPENIEFNKHTTAANNSCSPPAGVEYVVDRNDADGQECVELYDIASGEGAHRGTQQDEIATGEMEGSYFNEKPSRISDTELALICSAAGLGAMFVWTMYWKQMKTKVKSTMKTLGAVVLAQVLSYALEALPLHIALGNEIGAARWRSLFAFVDGTIAVAKDNSGPQGSANGSVLVLTGVVGEVRYSETREGVVWALTVMFDLMVTIVIAMTVFQKGGQIFRMNKEEIYVKGKMTGIKRKRRTMRRILRRMRRKDDDSDTSDERWCSSTTTSCSANSAVLGMATNPAFGRIWWNSTYVPQRGSMRQTEGAMNTVASPTPSSASDCQSVIISLQ